MTTVKEVTTVIVTRTMEEDNYEQCDCLAAELLQAEVELCTRAEEAKANLLAKQQELMETIEDTEARVEHLNQKVEDLRNERRELKLNVRGLKEKLAEERQKVMRLKTQENNSNKLEIAKVEQKLADAERCNHQLVEERKRLLEENQDLCETITVEQKDHSRIFTAMKAKYEARIAELVNKLEEDHQIRHDCEHEVMELESKLQDAREQINEKWRLAGKLQYELTRKDVEINELVGLLNKKGIRIVKCSNVSKRMTKMFLFVMCILSAYLFYDLFLK